MSKFEKLARCDELGLQVFGGAVLQNAADLLLDLVPANVSLVDQLACFARPLLV